MFLLEETLQNNKVYNNLWMERELKESIGLIEANCSSQLIV